MESNNTPAAKNGQDVQAVESMASPTGGQVLSADQESTPTKSGNRKSRKLR